MIECLVGITDLHPGMNGLAALRGSQELCFDLLECPELLLPRVRELFEIHRCIYAGLDAIIAPHQAGSTNRMGIWHPEKWWYVVSCDFSCMLSGEHFDTFVAPGIEMEQNFLEASMYHLDGPGALRPEGVHLIVHGCPDADTGRKLLRAAEQAAREGVKCDG